MFSYYDLSEIIFYIVFGLIGTAIISFILKWLLLFLGVYTIVRERQAIVYVLFRKQDMALYLKPH